MAVAHELRTPLTILQGTLQGMVDDVFPMEKKALASLLLQAEGLSRIVEDLRTLSLAIDQQLVVQREKTDLAALINAVVASARPMLDAHGMTVERSLAGHVASVDAQRIRQALLALIENACHYAAGGGRLRFELAVESGEARLRVLDRGPGFPPDICARDPKPFLRGEPSRSRATGGTGLGLSVVQSNRCRAWWAFAIDKQAGWGFLRIAGHPGPVGLGLPCSFCSGSKRPRCREPADYRRGGGYIRG
jgi:two-component system sensor histidine kinase AdeS